MTQALQDTFLLEESEEFDKAFELYNSLYLTDKSNYEVWKHFYFFLWTAIEDAPSVFHERINLRHLLQVMFDEGKHHFSDLADFNFIAGWTVSIFPYEYGYYYDLEEQGIQMLSKATQIEPTNKVYNLAYLGAVSKADDENYKNAGVESAPEVLRTFQGQGSLNKYFRQVLYRLDKKA